MSIHQDITEILNKFEDSELKIKILSDGSFLCTLAIDGIDDFSKINESLQDTLKMVLSETDQRY